MGTLGDLKRFALDFVLMSLGNPSLKIAIIICEVWCCLVFHGPKGLLGLVNHYGPSI